MSSTIVNASKLKLQAECLSTYSLAAQQNAYPLFRGLGLHYQAADNETPDPKDPLRRLVVELSSSPDIFSTEKWIIDEIQAGQTISLQQRPINIPHDFLFGLT
ncbi:hypothetical protein N9J88_04920 [Porticoccaceae bacterium]|nr:hypothetical protein [Porticoccaceae bacterium]